MLLLHPPGHPYRTAIHSTFPSCASTSERSRAPVSALLEAAVWACLSRSYQSVDIVFLFLLLLHHNRIRVLHSGHAPHVLKFRDACAARTTTAITSTSLAPAASSRIPIAILPPLCLDLNSPFLHHLFGREPNDEVLDAGIALPEDLARVRTCAKRRISISYDQNIPARYFSTPKTILHRRCLHLYSNHPSCCHSKQGSPYLV